MQRSRPRPAPTLEPASASLLRLHEGIAATRAAEREISLIDLVLLGCDVAEDAGEVCELVDAAVQGGAAVLLPADDDPMLARVPARSCCSKPTQRAGRFPSNGRLIQASV